MSIGWRYFKYGDCATCGDPEGSLSVPVLNGEKFTDKDGKTFIRGSHVFNFPPICKKCQNDFLLDTLCIKHKAPLRKNGQCLLCPS